MEPWITPVITGLAVILLGALWSAAMSHIRKVRRFFRVRWREARLLRPEHLLPVRASPDVGFRSFYRLRPEDGRIREALLSGRNVLVVGPPLAGKTRAVYESLRALPPTYDVSVVREVDFSNLRMPFHFRRTFNREIVVLDDVDRLSTKPDFLTLLETLNRRRAILVATCRTAQEELHFEANARNWTALFPVRVEMGVVDEEAVEAIRAEAGLDDRGNFYGPIGSLFLPLEHLRTQLHSCSADAQALLDILRSIHMAGAFSVKEGVPEVSLRAALASLEGLELKDDTWRKLMKDLASRGILAISSGQIRCEEALLENIVGGEADTAECVQMMLPVFGAEGAVLVQMGKTASEQAASRETTKRLCEAAIAAYQQALMVYIYEDAPVQFAGTQNNLGNAYGKLAEVEDRAQNCHLAVAAFEEALRVLTFDAFPMDYGTTQSNLGSAFRLLAEVENRAANCRLAIAALEQALRVHTVDDSPRLFSVTQNNLGNAYRTLAEVEDKAENCRLAIAAYEQALRVSTFDDFPMQFGMTQHNLGNAYCTLASAEDRGENGRLAIVAFEQALRVHTMDDSPMRFSVTENSLGNAYRTLAEVEDKAANCRLAIAAYEQALRVSTFDDFPIQFALTQHGLGNAYCTLAEAENKTANCHTAIAAFEQALRVRTFDDFPMQFAMTQNSLGSVRNKLAEVEDTAANCSLAIAAFEQALRVRTFDDLPMDYATTQNNLGNAYRTLAEVEDKAENCRLAIAAYEQALRVSIFDDFPMQFGVTQYNLGIAYCKLAEVEDRTENCRLAIIASECALRSLRHHAPPAWRNRARDGLEWVRQSCRDSSNSTRAQ